MRALDSSTGPSTGCSLGWGQREPKPSFRADSVPKSSLALALGALFTRLCQLCSLGIGAEAPTDRGLNGKHQVLQSSESKRGSWGQGIWVSVAGWLGEEPGIMSYWAPDQGTSCHVGAEGRADNKGRARERTHSVPSSFRWG